MPTTRKPSPYAEALLVVALLALAVLARAVGWREKTNDMNIFFQWYNQLKAAGGWRGLDTEIGNYNAPFLYLLAVVLNASVLGQMDAMWAAPALGAVYFLLRDRAWWGAAFCGAALAVKPQGVFVLPLLLLLALTSTIRWRTLLAAPAAYLALALPAVLLGRDPVELLTVYGLDRQSRIVEELSASWSRPHCSRSWCRSCCRACTSAISSWPTC
jgi:hypothetical protein